MTTTNASAVAVQATPREASATDIAPSGKSAVVTLQDLANEMKMSARDARMLLRLAAKQTKQYPNIGKDHVARQPWQWAPGSKALHEARKALATSV